MHRLKEYADARGMSLELARSIARLARRMVSETGRFTLCLSGGSSPRLTYRLLAQADMPWDETHVFMGDERMVPPSHEWSNHRMADEELLSRVPVPPSNVHRIRGELADPDAAARDYEEQMRSVFGRGTRWPDLDVCLLGLGSDGHTASLFPNHGPPADGSAWAVGVTETTLPPRVERVSLALPAINASKKICFIVLGEQKRALVDRILRDRETAARRYPAARVEGKDITWFVAPS